MLTRLTALDGEAILPLADAKASARILSDAEDDVLAALRDAAVGHVERVSGIALAEADFRWTMRSFPTRVDLPMRPVTDLGAVVYHDSDGAEQTYADARLVDGSVYAAADGSWPTAYDYAAITFTAGLASVDDAPEMIAAAKMQFQILEDRGRSPPEYIKAMEKSVDALIGSYRQVLV